MNRPVVEDIDRDQLHRDRSMGDVEDCLCVREADAVEKHDRDARQKHSVEKREVECGLEPRCQNALLRLSLDCRPLEEVEEEGRDPHTVARRRVPVDEGARYLPMPRRGHLEAEHRHEDGRDGPPVAEAGAEGDAEGQDSDDAHAAYQQPGGEGKGREGGGGGEGGGRVYTGM